MKTTLAASAVLSLCAISASAATYDFTGPTFPLTGSNLGKSAVFDDTTNTSSVTAIAINTEEPPSPQINQNSQGLGVNTGGIFQNQIENIGDDEAIVFDFGGSTMFETLSLTLASFDDDYRIYGSNDASVAACTTGGLSCLTSVSTLLASGSGSGIGGGADITFASGAVYRFLIATTPGGSGDGYRIDALSATAVPIPASILLMAGALGGLAAVRRKRT